MATVGNESSDVARSGSGLGEIVAGAAVGAVAGAGLGALPSPAAAALGALAGAAVAWSRGREDGAAEACPATPAPVALEPLLAEALQDKPVALVDTRGVVLFWSDGLAALTGHPAAARVGQSWEVLFPPGEARQGRPEALVAPGAGPGRHEVHMPLPAGEERILELTLTPLPADAPTAWRVQARDVTRPTGEDQAAQRHEATLEAARRMEAAARLRGELLTGVTHDLRTPLNAIVGFAQLLHDERVAPLAPAHKEFAADILTSAERLLRLVNDTLDLAKLEAGKMEFRPQEFAVDVALARARDLLRATAADAGVTLEIDVAPDLGPVRVDPDRFQQIVVNYLSNAVKVSPRGGRVTLRARPVGDAWVRVEVQDEGPGISAADVPLLFSDFRQFPSSGSRLAGGGAGLGLALTRRLVETQRGRVGVHAAPGGGCVFFAVLPRRPMFLTGPQVVYFPPEQPVVLLIEPDAAQAAHHAAALTAAGLRPRVAESGEAALELAARDGFDLVALPLVLPDMTGLDVLRALRLDGHEGPAILATPDGDAQAVYGHAVTEVVRAGLPSAELAQVARRALPRRAPSPPGRPR